MITFNKILKSKIELNVIRRFCSSINLASPLDGRYKSQLDEIRDIYSENSINNLKQDLVNNNKPSSSTYVHYISFNSFITKKYNTKLEAIINKSLAGLIEQAKNKEINEVANGKTNLNKKIILADQLSVYKNKLEVKNKQLTSSLINPIKLVFEKDDLELKRMLADSFNIIYLQNITLNSFCVDMWGYISNGNFIQKTKAGEIGSSTMPHKVNPIDFENAEGNLGISNAYIEFFTQSLLTSRFQGDMTNEVTFENIGSGLGFLHLALNSLQKGLNKLEIK